MKASVHTLVPVLSALVLRTYLHQGSWKAVTPTALNTNPHPRSLPWREFKADMVAWLFAGILMALFYTFGFHAPTLTVIKILLGCISFGLFGGMLSYLSAEKEVIRILSESGAGMTVLPNKIFSVTRKMLILILTVLLFMVTVVLLMVFMDVQYMLANRASYGPEIFSSVLNEILFAFGVLLGLSLLILGKYSSNMRMLLENQIQVMERIGRGEYTLRVPVVSNDEFGLIASKTNDMIEGLRERDLCQVSFGKYVTPVVSEKILRGDVSAEGELSEVTILFCDLRGYTPFVEKREPSEVVRFLNSYFSEMEQAVREHNGIVLQYIGDEIEAVFGGPIPEPEHPQKAVSAAREMRERLRRLNEQRSSSGEPPVQHGIGIHTGVVLMGNVGSPERLVYAMVGDAVNAASRIQNLNKTYETDILISRTTMERLRPGAFDLLSLGRTLVKGKSEEMEIFKVL